MQGGDGPDTCTRGLWRMQIVPRESGSVSLVLELTISLQKDFLLAKLLKTGCRPPGAQRSIGIRCRTPRQVHTERLRATFGAEVMVWVIGPLGDALELILAAMLSIS